MKKILIMDAFSTIHVGNGALLENSIEICKQAFPDSKISILTIDKESNVGRHKNIYDDIFSDFPRLGSTIKKTMWTIKFIPFIFLQIVNHYFIKKDPVVFTLNKKQKEYINVIKESDLCISISGETFNDIYYKHLYRRLFTFWVAMKFGKKLIVFPQSIGPIYKPLTIFLLKKIMNQVTLFAGRDKKSYELLKKLQLPLHNICYSPDVAILQKTGQYCIDSYFNNESNKKTVGITVSHNPDEIKTKVNYIDRIVKGIDKSLDNNKYRLLIMPSNFIKNGKSVDYKLCEVIHKELIDKNYEVSMLDNRLYFPDEFKTLLTQLDFFISTRMHVMILAFSGITPTIGINTQHKIRGFMKNISMDHFCLEFDELHKLPELIDEIKINRKALCYKINTAINKLKAELNLFTLKFKNIYND